MSFGQTMGRRMASWGGARLAPGYGGDRPSAKRKPLKSLKNPFLAAELRRIQLHSGVDQSAEACLTTSRRVHPGGDKPRRSRLCCVTTF